MVDLGNIRLFQVMWYSVKGVVREGGRGQVLKFVGISQGSYGMILYIERYNQNYVLERIYWFWYGDQIKRE